MLTLAALVVLGGCGSPPSPSPEEQRVADVNERCAALEERFTGDLALDGESFGAGDLDILNSRAELVRELAEHVRGLPEPESDQPKFDRWLVTLDDLVTEINDLDEDMTNAQMGSDMVIAMQIGIVDDSTEAAGRAADEARLSTCADITSWLIFPPE